MTTYQRVNILTIKRLLPINKEKWVISRGKWAKDESSPFITKRKLPINKKTCSTALLTEMVKQPRDTIFRWSALRSSVCGQNTCVCVGGFWVGQGHGETTLWQCVVELICNTF